MLSTCLDARPRRKGNEADVFFSFLETSWGFGSAEGVIAFLTDGRMPAPTCVARIDLTVHGKRDEAAPVCTGESPYLAYLTTYIGERAGSIDDLFYRYGVALARGDIRGAPPAKKLVKTVTHQILPAAYEFKTHPRASKSWLEQLWSMIEGMDPVARDRNPLGEQPLTLFDGQFKLERETSITWSSRATSSSAW